MPIATRDLIDGVFDDSQHGSDTQDAPGAVHQETKYSKRNVLLEVPKAPCRIFDYIKYQVDTNPDAPALQYESDPPISYAQLDKLTERIARALSVRRGTIVPICMDVSVNLIATIVAILRAGAAYLVLDPRGSVERNNGVIEDCNANIAIVDTHYAPSYEKGIILDAALSKLASYERKQHEIEEASVTDAAYLVYTSGATGTPKGVVVTHSAASHGIAHFSLGERTRWLLFYNPIFSAAQRTILATLSKGACVCLASRDKMATSLFEIVQEMQIDALGLTPSALALLSASEVPACLKQITTVGEPLSQEIANEWSDKVELRVSYGLSECAQLNFATKLHKGDNARRLEAPKDTTNAFILQPHTTKRVEAGRQGELCLEGPQIAAGYYHREEQTDAAFIDNPFGSGKVYRTGDLAIRHHDGSFEVLGRIDSQIKVHGQRLEPAEVSAALSKHVGIRSLAVLGATIKGRMSLVAAIIPGNGFEWTTLVQDLRETAQRSLAPYMIPSYWLQLNTLPHNSNGKLDVKKIRRLAEKTATEDMLGYRLKNDDKSEAPLNDGEIAIRDAWASALSLDPKLIQKANSFNTLGGNSMDAIGVVRELRGRGWKVELGAMLKARGLSDVDIQPLDAETQPGTHETPRHALIGDKIVQDELSRDRTIVDAYPLTQLQGSLFASTLDGNLDYLYQRVYDVRHLDLVKLKLAFEAVFKSNEMLRTIYQSSRAGMLQVVRNDLSLPWQEALMPLEEFKQLDKQKSVTFGQLLVRFTVLGKQLLVVSMHHSLFDFWSHTFLYEDAARLYLGLDRIERPQFRAFVDHLQQEDLGPANDFWKSYLEYAEPSILNNVPSQQTAAGSRYFHRDIKQGARALGVTSGSLIYAAWGIILARHTGLSEAVFATAIAGREAPVHNVESLDGPTLTIVPQRVVLDQRSTLAQVVRTTHESFWDVMKHSQHGMRRALTVSGHQGTQLFDTMVNILVQNSSPDQVVDQVFHPHGPKPSWQTEWSTLDVEEHDDGLQLSLRARMPQRRVDFILDQLIVTLSKVLENANERVGSVDLLGTDERHWLSSAEYFIETKPQLLHSRVDEMMRRHPDSIALQWQTNQTITYNQLDSKVNQMAAYLLENGLRPGGNVPLLLEKSPTMIIAILAVLRLGGSYVPLSPENPLDRNLFILGEIEAACVLTETTHEGYFPGNKVSCLKIDQVDLTEYTSKNPGIEVKVDQLAYIIYTSGSTGQPKGVMIEHQAVAAAIESILSFEGRQSQIFKTMQFSNYVFDVSVYDIFVPLSSGHTLCMAPSDRLLTDLANVINEMEVNHCFLTPTVARLLDPNEVPSLKILTVGGESVTSDIVDKWADGHTLMNGYGPTETSILATMKSIDSTTNPRNIGRPLPTIKAYIIEPDGHGLVPWGAIGELSFSGPQLGQGYINKPEQTAAAFLEYGIEDISRIYRTGDLARWLPNGDIECLGRKDNQVKINGFRIELGEVEQSLLKAPSVKDAAVVVVEPNHQVQMIAFVVIDMATAEEQIFLEDLPDELKELRQSLKSLAHYMMPKAVVPMSNMPKLPSGKTDRKSLKAKAIAMSPDDLSRSLLNAPRRQGTMIPPETGEQKVLQRAWAAVLSISADDVSLDSSFLTLGGDSIGAINLASQLRKDKYSLSVGTILRSSNLEDMAACMERKDEEESGAKRIFEPPVHVQMVLEQCGLGRNAFEYIYPCPPGQSEFLAQGARPEQYWAVMAIRVLAPSTDIQAWIAMAKGLANTNEILRTTFVERRGLWYGAVLNDATPDVTFEDVADDEAAKTVIERVWQTRFKSGKPYLSYTILRLPEGVHKVVIKMDHGLYDGTLLRVFDDHAKHIQHNQPVPDFTPFHDFATQVWSSNKSRALKFWSEPKQRPTTFQYPIHKTPTIHSTYVLTSNIQIDAYVSKTGYTPSIIFQAAFQIWLAQRSSAHDVSFDYLYTGRNVPLPNPQSINGTCANFLPLRSELSASQTVTQYLAQTTSSFWKATENSNVGLTEIYNAAGLDRNEATNTALFLFQPFEPPAGASAEDEMRWVVMARSEVRMPQPYGVVFEIMRLSDGFKFRFGYDESVFDQVAAKGAVEEVEGIVKSLVGGDEERKMGEVFRFLYRLAGSRGSGSPLRQLEG